MTSKGGLCLRSTTCLVAGTMMMIPALSAIAAEADQPMLEEVIVTARKRSEKLLDIPASVAAVTMETMAEAGVKNMGDLQFKVANFTMAESPIGTSIGIRGIYSGINQGFEQSVGTYIDGLSYGRAQQARAPFLDVERVEVLRGPQSILFGKSAIAGALNITTAQPQSTMGGYARLAYEPDTDGFEATSAVTGPITDKVRLRVAGRYNRTDGYMRNATLDRPEVQREDWQVRGTLAADIGERLTLTLKAETGRFDATGRETEIIGETPALLPSANPLSTFVNGLTYAQILSGGGAVPVNTRIAAVNAATGMQLLSLPAAGSATLDNVRNDTRSANGDSSSNDAQTYLLRADWDAGFATLTAISGVTRFSYDEECDCDFTGAPLLDAPQAETYRQFSQEVRLVSNGGGDLDYIAGGYFQHSSDDYRSSVRITGSSPLVPLVYNQGYGAAFEAAAAEWLAAHPGDAAGAVAAGRAAGTAGGGAGLALAGTQSTSQARVTADQWSLFSQATWHATDILRATFGARLNRETKDGERSSRITDDHGAPLTGQQALLAPLAYAGLLGITTENLLAVSRSGVPGVADAATQALARLGALPVTGSLSKTRLTPSVSLQYNLTPDDMVYVSWVMGAKSGGFDYRANNRGAAASMAQSFRFEEEKARTWEAGLKSRLWNGRAEVNLGAFHTDYEDLQVSIFDGLLGFNVGNAAAATVKGLEMDGRVALGGGLSAQGSFAWTDFRFDSFPNGQCYPGQTPAGPAADRGFCSYAGKTNQFVPDYSGSAGLSYLRDIGSSLVLSGSADLFFTGRYHTSPALDPSLIQPAYARLDLRLGLADADDSWEGAVLVRNVTNQRPMTFADTTPLSYGVFGARSAFAYFAQGRSVTVQAKVNF